MTLHTQNYDIHFFETFSDFLNFFVPTYLQNSSNSKIAFLLDTNFYQFWLEKLTFLHDIAFFLVPSGEKYKNLNTLQEIWKFFMEEQLDRKSLVICMGGGVLGDMGGFAAATFMRGLPYIQIPTTLLSMVDSSVGAKTGIDFMNVKNILGTFYPPQKVLICSEFLKTLPERQITAGKAEMIKHGFIFSDNHLNEIEQIDLNSIFHSVKIKKYFVEKDPFEKNIRRALNFGHTVGHAIEAYCLDNELDVLHGEAVIYGMYLESLIFKELGLMKKKVYDEFHSFIQNYLTQLPNFLFNIHYKAWFPYIFKDKKKQSDLLLLPVIHKIGKYKIHEVSIKSFELTLNNVIT